MQLEKSLGKTLFDRTNNKFVLTEEGELVLDYANQIFEFSQELLNTLKTGSLRNVVIIRLGVVDQVSKQIVNAVLKNIYAFKTEARVIVHEGSLEHMLEELKVHALDLLLSNIDVPQKRQGLI